ncbi:hypothetical protein BJX99DRAFT_81752 [Aspergillus californicus]
MSQSLKRAESPAKSSLPKRPDVSNPKTAPADTHPVQSSSRPSSRTSSVPALRPNVSSRRPSIKGGTNPQQGPAPKPSAHPPRELPEGPKSTENQKGKKPISPAEDTKQLQEHIAQLESSQETSKQKIQELETLLAKEHEVNSHIASERDKAAAQAEENWKLWKRTAGELRRAKQVPALYQITDSHLSGLIQQLRYSIRDFAVLHFAGNRHIRVPSDSIRTWETCMIPTTPGTHAYKEYLMSPDRCHSIIQGMIWRLLALQVFGQFVWAGKTGESLCSLRYYLKYASRNEAPDPDVERKFQMWSAEATALVLQMCDFAPGSQEHKRTQSTLDDIRGDFWNIAEQFVTKRSRESHQDFRQILETALALDIEIHRQAARITWEFPPENAQLGFDPSKMEVEKGQQRPKPEQLVLLVVAPAVTKKGKSDGSEFQAGEQLLVPLEVSCQPPVDVSGGGSESSFSFFGVKF